MDSYYFSNKKIKTDDKEDEISRIKVDRWIFIIQLMVISFVPMIVTGYMVETISPKISQVSILSSGFQGEIFTHYKMIFLIILTVIALLLFISKLLFMNGEIIATKLNLFIYLLMFIIVISTILSPYISTSIWGLHNRSDGAISYLCYLILFFISMNITYPKKAIDYLVYSLYPFLLVNLILITMNFYGFDALTFEPIKKLLSITLPEGASLGDDSQLLGTLNQWNYMSGMFAIMTILFLSFSILSISTVKSLIGILGSIISFTIMLMSISTSGFLTFTILLPVILYLLFRSSNKKKSVPIFLSFLVIMIPIFHVLADKDYRVWDESIGNILKDNPYIYNNSHQSADFNFGFKNEVYAAESKFDLPVLPESGMAPGSGRLYIWQKTLEEVKKRPLFGYGLDTLLYEFPHYHIEARAQMRDENTIVDKPHNMYLGVLYGTGILGFITLIAIILITIKESVSYLKTGPTKLLVVLMLAWTAYLIQAFFNDSLPSTSGPMWTIAGILMGLILSDRNDEEKINE